MSEDHIATIVNKLISDDLAADKIKAFAEVIQALKGIHVKEVDDIKDDENAPELLEDNPIDIGEITGVQVDNKSVEKVQIYKDPDYAPPTKGNEK